MIGNVRLAGATEGSWFLLDTKRPIKGVILQQRTDVPVDFTALEGNSGRWAKSGPGLTASPRALRLLARATHRLEIEVAQETTLHREVPDCGGGWVRG